MPLAAAASAALAPTVDHRLGRVQIERHRLRGIAAEAAVKLVATTRRGPLDRVDMAGTEPAGQLPGGRRRRRLGDRPPRRQRVIGPQHLDVVKAGRTDQLRLSDRDHKLARREPPSALFDRRHPPSRLKLGVGQLHQPQIARQLAADRQPRVRRQRRIISADQKPSGPSVTVNDHHPLGEFHSQVVDGITTRHDKSHPGRKAPEIPGLFHDQPRRSHPAASAKTPKVRPRYSPNWV